jgi:monodictyphenone polyketide synthase
MAAYTPPSEDQQRGNHSSLVHFSNEFPNDDLTGRLRRLYSLSKHQRHPILGRFLDDATRTLRQEVGGLHSELSLLVSEFESIINLAADTKLRKGALCTSIDSVLLCVLQLGTFIGCDYLS